MIVNQRYTKDLEPFLVKVIDWAKERKIPNLDEYIKERKWKLRASGNLVTQSSSVEFTKATPHFVAIVKNAHIDIKEWLITVCEYTYIQKGK